MNTTSTTQCKCPWCGYLVDASTGDGTPSPGDISICLKCLNLNTYTADLSLEKMNEEAYFELMNDAETKAKVELFRKVIIETRPKQ